MNGFARRATARVDTRDGSLPKQITFDLAAFTVATAEGVRRVAAMPHSVEAAERTTPEASTQFTNCKKASTIKDSMSQMQFQYESDLCAVLSGELDRKLAKPGQLLHMLAEVQVGKVIPDLLAVRLNGGAPNMGKVTGFESWVIAELMRGRALHAETISRRLYARANKVDSALARLEYTGVVQRTPTGACTLTGGNFPHGAAVIAVEAKLIRWKDAIEQAKTYLNFANQAYIALPQDSFNAASLPIREGCARASLGLIVVTREKTDIIVDAPHHTTRTPGWVWAVGKVTKCANRSLLAQN